MENVSPEKSGVPPKMPMNGVMMLSVRDFTTAPMLSDSLARAIGAWAGRALRESGCRDLIEIGPGEGTLAAGVLRNLPWHVRWRTRLHLVETSGPLAERQRELLGKRARWHETMEDALDACGGKAVIWSNELVDAFPVRRFQKTPEGWREMAVQRDSGGKVVESLISPAPLPDSSVFSEEHPQGQCLEVHDSYRRYLTGWLPKWRSGRMLTIDYGAEAEGLYHRRPRGTVRGYLLQQRVEGMGIYENPGRQDLTADVNFTDLRDWARAWVGMGSVCTFREFLNRWNPGAGESDPTLVEEDGAGEAFLVLEQGPGAS